MRAKAGWTANLRWPDDEEFYDGVITAWDNLPYKHRLKYATSQTVPGATVVATTPSRFEK